MTLKDLNFEDLVYLYLGNGLRNNKDKIYSIIISWDKEPEKLPSIIVVTEKYGQYKTSFYDFIHFIGVLELFIACNFIDKPNFHQNFWIGLRKIYTSDLVTDYMNNRVADKLFILFYLRITDRYNFISKISSNNILFSLRNNDIIYYESMKNNALIDVFNGAGNLEKVKGFFKSSDDYYLALKNPSRKSDINHAALHEFDFLIGFIPTFCSLINGQKNNWNLQAIIWLRYPIFEQYGDDLKDLIESFLEELIYWDKNEKHEVADINSDKTEYIRNMKKQFEVLTSKKLKENVNKLLEPFSQYEFLFNKY